MRAVAASTETSAVRRCGVTAQAYSGERLERPDDHVLATRVVAERLALALYGRDRREADLRLGRLERPEVVVDLRPAEAAAAVDRVEAVALDEEPLEGARPRAGNRAVGSVAPAEDPARLGEAGAVVVDPVAAAGRGHACVAVWKGVEAPRCLDRDARGGVEGEEPDARLLTTRAHVGAYVELEEGRDGRHRQRPTRA